MNDARPSGYTIDGVPWEEPRGPHLPDLLAGQPRLIWPFLVLALLIVVQAAARLAHASNALTADGVVRSVLATVAPVSVPLLGVAWFRRRPAPAIVDPMSIAVTLLALSQLLRFASQWAVDWLASSMFGSDSTFASIRASGTWSTLAAAVSLLGSLYFLRAIRRARRSPDSALQRPVLLAVAVAAVVTVTLNVWFVWMSAIPGDDAVFPPALRGLLFSWISVTIAAAVAAALLSGAIAGESPRIGWRLGALAYCVELGGLLLASLTVLQPQALQSLPWLFELYQWSFTTISTVAAVALLAAVALGLPPVAEPGRRPSPDVVDG